MLWIKGQYLSGQRLTGLVYSSILFFLKLLGIAIGGGLVGFMLSFYGYTAKCQCNETATGIALCFTVLPAPFSLLVAMIMQPAIF